MLDIQNILKNIDSGLLDEIENMQENLHKQLGEIPVMGEAGGGLIRVHGTAQGNATKVEIDESLMSRSSKKTLEDLLVAAFNVKEKKATKAANDFKKQETMSAIPDLLTKKD